MFKKGDKVRYTSHLGSAYTAIVKRAHKDGSYTVRLYFPVKDGKEVEGCFQGDVFRVSRNQVDFWARPIREFYRDEGQEPRDRHSLPGVYKR